MSDGSARRRAALGAGGSGDDPEKSDADRPSATGRPAIGRSAAFKRNHTEVTYEDKMAITKAEEPPSKEVLVRRPGLRLRSQVPTARRVAEEPPEAQIPVECAAEGVCAPGLFSLK